MTLLAACSAILAVQLVMRPARRPPGVRPGSASPMALLAAGVGLSAVLARLSPVTAALAVLVGAAALAGVALARAARRRRAAAAVSGRVLEACELLAAELAAGSAPGAALDRAATAWPLLAPAAEAFRVGADVPAALRALGSGPGARDLRVVAAAWQVSHRTGQGLAGAVGRVADGLRAAQASRRVVAGELASARATARVVACLPLLALAMGSGAGGDPWAFLLGRPAGLACLGGGLAFGLAGLWWIEAIARDVDRSL